MKRTLILGDGIMNKAMFSINNVRQLEVIDINSGTKLGYIKDLRIDCDRYKVVSIIIPDNKKQSTWFSKSEDIEISWEKIHKVGQDVILIDGEEYIDEE